MLAVQASGAEVVTIEGMAKNGKLHPVQQAFTDCHALQCGFCTPGMIMAVAALLKDNPHPSDEEIYHGLEGNLCRCTGYINIVKAVKQAAHVTVQGEHNWRGVGVFWLCTARSRCRRQRIRSITVFRAWKAAKRVRYAISAARWCWGNTAAYTLISARRSPAVTRGAGPSLISRNATAGKPVLRPLSGRAALGSTATAPRAEAGRNTQATSATLQHAQLNGCA